jgi:hypothetical protein
MLSHVDLKSITYGYSEELWLSPTNQGYLLLSSLPPTPSFIRGFSGRRLCSEEQREVNSPAYQPWRVMYLLLLSQQSQNLAKPTNKAAQNGGGKKGS